MPCNRSKSCLEVRERNARITELTQERDEARADAQAAYELNMRTTTELVEARADAKKWENRTRCLFTKYCSRTFDCPTESYLERTIVKLDEEIAAVDKET